MPNPKLYHYKQDYSFTPNQLSQLTQFGYYGPRGPTWNPETGAVDLFYCNLEQKWYRALDTPGAFRLKRVEGFKHVPYVAAEDNLDPCAYNMLLWNFDYPYANISGTVVRNDHAGFPIECGPGFIPDCKISCDYQPPVTYATITEQMEAEAVSNLNSSIADQRDVTVNWALAALEGDKTLAMIANRVGTLVKTLRYLRKGSFEKAYKALFGKRPHISNAQQLRRLRKTKDNAASLWLEWTYGWSPTLNDVFNAMDDFTKQQRTLILRAKGKSISVEEDETDVVQTFGSEHFTPSLGYTLKTKRSAMLKYTSYYRIDARKFANAEAAGLLNPASLLWELTTLSFVFDWFANVGDVLQDLTIASGLEHLTTIRSQLLKTEVIGLGGGPFTHTRSTEFRAEGTAYVRYAENRVEFTRSSSGARPRVPLVINSQPLNVRRIISSIALLNNLGKGLISKKTLKL